MKKASRIMFTIGKVFNIIAIVISAILIIFGLIAAATGGLVGGIIDLAGADGAAEEVAPAIIAFVGAFYIVFGLILLGLNIAAIVVLSKARASIEAGSLETKPHVLTIVFGALTNTFYLLAGIFGLVARNQDIKAQNNWEDIS